MVMVLGRIMALKYQTIQHTNYSWPLAKMESRNRHACGPAHYTIFVTYTHRIHLIVKLRATYHIMYFKFSNGHPNTRPKNIQYTKIRHIGRFVSTFGHVICRTIWKPSKYNLVFRSPLYLKQKASTASHLNSSFWFFLKIFWTSISSSSSSWSFDDENFGRNESAFFVFGGKSLSGFCWPNDRVSPRPVLPRFSDEKLSWNWKKQI